MPKIFLNCELPANYLSIFDVVPGSCLPSHKPSVNFSMRSHRELCSGNNDCTMCLYHSVAIRFCVRYTIMIIKCDMQADKSERKRPPDETKTFALEILRLLFFSINKTVSMNINSDILVVKIQWQYSNGEI